ncbi:MAG: hypothetical protein CUN55_19660, partial [Phototrophicales bacterium]
RNIDINHNNAQAVLTATTHLLNPDVSSHAVTERKYANVVKCLLKHAERSGVAIDKSYMSTDQERVCSRIERAMARTHEMYRVRKEMVEDYIQERCPNATVIERADGAHYAFNDGSGRSVLLHKDKEVNLTLSI